MESILVNFGPWILIVGLIATHLILSKEKETRIFTLEDTLLSTEASLNKTIKDLAKDKAALEYRVDQLNYEKEKLEKISIRSALSSPVPTMLTNNMVKVITKSNIDFRGDVEKQKDNVYIHLMRSIGGNFKFENMKLISPEEAEFIVEMWVGEYPAKINNDKN